MNGLAALGQWKQDLEGRRRLNLFAAFCAAMNDHRRHSAEKGSHAVSMGTDDVRSARAPRLYLVTPPLGDPDAIADDLAAALNAADIAAVLLRLADGDERALIERIEALRILIQSNGAALLLDGHAGARRAHARPTART